MSERLGHCLCGEVRFQLRGPHNWVGHCHCDSCRRATASPVTTFIGHPDGHWAWQGKTPSVYASSQGVERLFCPTCGSPIAYRSQEIPGETHFYAALLADPNSVTPTVHWHYDEHLPWPKIRDDLKKHSPGQ